MAVSAFFATKVTIIFFDGVFYLDDANTIVTSTFLLRYVRHWLSPSLGYISIFVVMREKVVDHNFQDTVNAGICHRIKHLFAPPF